MRINTIELEGKTYLWKAQLLADCEGHFFMTYIWYDGEVIYKKLTKGITINEKYIINKILDVNNLLLK